MNAQNILESLIRFATETGKPLPTLEQVESALSTIDETAKFEQCRARIEAVMWDGVSNINAGTPEQIREENPWADVVYVLVIDGGIVYMQTHTPFDQGHVPITLETVDAISSAHADYVANQMAGNEILSEVKTILNLN